MPFPLVLHDCLGYTSMTIRLFSVFCIPNNRKVEESASERGEDKRGQVSSLTNEP